MVYNVKRFRYSPIHSKWELIREFPVEADKVTPVLENQPPPVEKSWRYEVKDDKGKAVATIETVNPSLFD